MHVWTTDSKPKLLAGSSEGYIGHIDGRPRDARLNHPKGLTVDDSGNIYIADTLNMAIRKISDEGITWNAWASQSVSQWNEFTKLIYGLFGLIYLSLSINVNTWETFWKS
jgi:hypothetical protein